MKNKKMKKLIKAFLSLMLCSSMLLNSIPTTASFVYGSEKKQGEQPELGITDEIIAESEVTHISEAEDKDGESGTPGETVSEDQTVEVPVFPEQTPEREVSQDEVPESGNEDMAAEDIEKSTESIEGTAGGKETVSSDGSEETAESVQEGDEDTAGADDTVYTYVADNGTVLKYKLKSSTNLITITKCSQVGSDGKVVVPEKIGDYTVAEIGSYAFDEKSEMTELSLPSTLKVIGGSAFNKCSGIKEVTIPAGLTDIGTYTFNYCTGLETVVFSEGLSLIGGSMFEKCTSLGPYVYIPDSVKTIGGDAFWGCSNLQGIRLPQKGVKLGQRFLKGTAIEIIFISSGVTFTDTWGCFKGADNLKKVYFNSGITKIPDRILEDASSVTFVSIPGSVTSIGKGAFTNCASLEDIILPSGLTEIGVSAFMGSGLKSISFPQGLQKIGSSAFYGCAFRKVSIPDSVTEIGGSAFSSNKVMTKFDFPKSVNPSFVLEGRMFYDDYKLSSVSIPESTKEIKESTFLDCHALKNVDIPEGVTKLGHSMFRYSGVEALYLPKSLAPCSISYSNPSWGVFSDARNLKYVEFAYGTTKIPKYLFHDSAEIETVSIPVTVSEIEPYAIEGTLSGEHPPIDNIMYAGSKSSWDHIVIGKGNEGISRAVIHYGAQNAQEEMATTARTYYLKKVASCNNNTGKWTFEDGTTLQEKECIVGGENLGYVLSDNSKAGKNVRIGLDENNLIVSAYEICYSYKGKVDSVSLQQNYFVAEGTRYYIDETSDADTRRQFTEALVGSDVEFLYPYPESGRKTVYFLKTVTKVYGELKSANSSGVWIESSTYQAEAEALDKAKNLVGKKVIGKLANMKLTDIYTPESELRVEYYAGGKLTSQNGSSFGTGYPGIKVKNTLKNKDDIAVVTDKDAYSVSITGADLTIAGDDVKVKNALGFDDGNNADITLDTPAVISLGEEYSIRFDKPVGPKQFYSQTSHEKKVSINFHLYGLQNGEAFTKEGSDELILINCGTPDIDESTTHINQKRDEVVDGLRALNSDGLITWDVQFLSKLNSADRDKVKELLKDIFLMQVAMISINPDETGMKEWAKKYFEAELPLSAQKDEFKFTVRLYGADKKPMDVTFYTDIDSFVFGSAIFSNLGSVNYEIESGKYKTYSGSQLAATITKADLSSFFASAQDLIMSEIKKQYNVLWGNDAQAVTEEFVRDFRSKIFGNAIENVIRKRVKEDYKGLYFDLMTMPAKKAVMDCPVDVYVYDTFGNLAGSIVDDRTISCFDNNVELSVDEDAKIVKLYDNDYRLDIKSRRPGRMDVTFYEESWDGKILGMIKHDDLDLRGSDTYTANMGHEITQTTGDYVLEHNDQYREFDDEIPSGSYFDLVADYIPVEGISLSDSYEVAEGESLHIEPSFQPADATLKDAYYKSTDTSIATVDADGNILGISPGQCMISVLSRDGRYRAASTVTVSSNAHPPKKVTNITLNEESAEITMGDTLALSAEILPSDAANRTLLWKSTNTSVATVDNGTVTAVDAGTAKISASATDGSGVKAECLVKVKKAVYTVNASAGEGGVISPSGTVNTEKGTERTFVIIPDDEYEINEILLDGNRTETSEMIVINDDKDHTLSVTFKQKGSSGGDDPRPDPTPGPAPGPSPSPEPSPEPGKEEKEYTEETGDTTPYTAGGYMIANQKRDIKALFSDSQVQYSKYTVEPKGAATVNKYGMMKAKKAGTVRITGYYKEGKTWIQGETIEITIEKPSFSKKTVKNLVGGIGVNLGVRDINPIASKLSAEDWTSSKKSVADIDPITGVITAKKTGKTKITAKYQNAKYSFTLDLRVQDMKTKSVKLKRGKTKKLSLKYAADEIVWSSDNEDVATVDSTTGKVTALAPGTATITAKRKGFEYTCMVTVK